MPRTYTKRPLRDRFWEKVAKADADECWEWTAARRCPNGYGQITLADGKNGAAHRVAWEITHGPIPAGLHVLHACDNPPCVNPRHLWLGTNTDNAADMDAKGRRGRPGVKLTECSVALIRLRISRGEPRKTLAREYGVGRTAIAKVVQRQTWAHVLPGEAAHA